MFLVKKRVIYIKYQISDSRDRQNRVDEKGHQKVWVLKWKFFPKKRSFENFVRNIFSPSPQTQRQVSAHDCYKSSIQPMN